VIEVASTTFAFLVSALGTWLVREYALSHNVLDVPNERSSHSRPTPRGGGAAIAAAVLLSVSALWAQSALDARIAIAVLGAGGTVAIVGFLDDHRPIPARVRMAVHVVAAAWTLYWLRLPSAWQQIAAGVVPDWVGYVVLGIALVWLLNLFNFMDGIDGLASSQAMLVCFAGIVATLTPGADALPRLALVVGSASLGFLLWNFPPASIFMGDVGSGFLGIMLGIIGLSEFSRSVPEEVSWLILLAAFITDATVTLVRRWRRGFRLASAHRTHAYQHASRRWQSHRRVTMLVASANVFWLFPLAILVRRDVLSPMVGIFAAFVPMTVIVWRMGAGVPDEDS
jgi:Fuc2NAc and GlcNAc transferase